MQAVCLALHRPALCECSRPAKKACPIAVAKGGKGDRTADYSGFQKIMRQLVAANQAADRGLSDASVAGHLLRTRDAAGKPLSDEQLVCEFGVMFQGGHDTTARTMAWALCAATPVP
jgi:cytochrome P450